MLLNVLTKRPWPDFAWTKEVDADFIFYVDEHWAIYPKTIDEVLALSRKYGAVEMMPGRGKDCPNSN